MKIATISTLYILLLLSLDARAQERFLGVEVCANCHTGQQGGNQVDPWQMTDHATAYDSISAFVQQTARCLACHTTGWDTTQVNLGEDEFVSIEPPYTGNFNVTITDSAEFFKRRNVQCESCHGPSSEHVAKIFVDGTAPPRDAALAETCGECHQDEHHPFIEEWSESEHATSHSHPVPFLQSRFRNSPECSGCHTIQGFIQFVGTTAEDTTNLIPHVVPPGEDAKPLVCAACHDPHNKKHEAQLRLPAADLCVKCHNPEDPEPGEDVHHATSEMFAGEGAVEFPGFTCRNQSVHQILEPAKSEKCVACHVFTTPFDEGDPNDPSDDIPANTGHTFEPRVEGCTQTGCHDLGLIGTTEDMPFNHRGRQTRTDSLVAELEEILANASSEDSSTQAFAEGLFNLQFVTSSGSRGVHNPFYAEDVLVNTIEYLRGVLAVDPRPDERAGIPSAFALHPNYPNPFNPSTTIRFDVPEPSHVKLVIYNALGQVVEVLVDERLTPNTYEVTFNASNLSSGLYLYKLVADGYVSTRKMLLLK